MQKGILNNINGILNTMFSAILIQTKTKLKKNITNSFKKIHTNRLTKEKNCQKKKGNLSYMEWIILLLSSLTSKKQTQKPKHSTQNREMGSYKIKLIPEENMAFYFQCSDTQRNLETNLLEVFFQTERKLICKYSWKSPFFSIHNITCNCTT